MDETLPTGKSANSPDNFRKLRRAVAARGLCGLANDTKWDEFISAMITQKWLPYRCKCIDGPPSSWDTDWFFLPLPLMSIEWLDVAFLQETHEHRLPPRVHVTNHSGRIEELLRRVGLEYHKGETMIRIFGYSPKSLEFLDQP